MEEIFLAIIEKLTADVPEVRWVDFDLGQLDDEHPPVSFPCVLIGFEDSDYVDLSQGAQQGTLNINLRIGFRTYERTHSKAQQSFQQVGLEHLGTVRKVGTAMGSLSGTNFSTLTKRNFSKEKRSDLRVYNLTYETLLTEKPVSKYQPMTTTVEFCLDAGVNRDGVGQMIIERTLIVD